MSKTKQIFVVGSSRSGTTMMGRILGNHTTIFTFKELHFFGTIWNVSSNQNLNKTEQKQLLARLLCIQEYGIFNQQHTADFIEKASELLTDDMKNPLAIYDLFLATSSIENNATISCEQTPKNLYYLDEILKFSSDAKVINMVRDPRDVLLSQKNKWKRKFLGASKIPLSEAIRSYINYHPITTAKVWCSSLAHTTNYMNNDRVKIVKFEELLANSEHIVKEICTFVDIEFQVTMLKIPVVGSSTESDSKENLAIDETKKQKWKNGGLTNAEIYISQKMSVKMMDLFTYEKKKFSFPPILVLFYLLTFPIKLVLAFLLNIHRMGNVAEVIKKRFVLK